MASLPVHPRDNPNCYIKGDFHCLDTRCYEEGRNLCEELGVSAVLGIGEESPSSTEDNEEMGVVPIVVPLVIVILVLLAIIIFLLRHHILKLLRKSRTTGQVNRGDEVGCQELETLRTPLDEERKANDDSKRKVNEAKTEANEAEAEAEAEIAALQQRLPESTSSAEAELSRLGAELSRLRAEESRLRAELSGLQAELSSSETSRVELSLEASHLQQHTSRLEKESSSEPVSVREKLHKAETDLRETTIKMDKDNVEREKMQRGMDEVKKAKYKSEAAIKYVFEKEAAEDRKRADAAERSRAEADGTKAAADLDRVPKEAKSDAAGQQSMCPTTRVPEHNAPRSITMERRIHNVEIAEEIAAKLGIKSMVNSVLGTTLGLGSHVTHIYNAMESDILARVGSKYSEQLALAIGSRELTLEQIRKRTEDLGFTRIKRHSHAKFEPSYENGRAYANILMASGEIICEDHPVLDNRSLIVDADGNLRNTKMNEINIDVSDRVH